MKNKGFTLVELLAVIVVLSIIALIGFSSVGNIISSTQDNSNNITIKNYAKAVDQAVFLYEMNNEDSDLPELDSTWLKENVKFEKATVECDYATYNKTSSLYGCKVNDSDKTYCYTSDTAVECNKDKLSKIYGDSIQNGTPTPTSPVEIESVGEKTKNLLDIDSMLNEYLIKNDDCSYTIQKTSTGRFSKQLEVDIPADTYLSLSGEILEYNGTYRYPVQLALTFEDDTSTTMGIANDIARTNQYTKAIKSISIYQDSSMPAGTYAKFKNLQLEIGNEKSSYEPYGYRIPITVSNGTETKTTNIYLKEPLRKIGEYADYLDLTNKKVVRNVKELVFNGTENIEKWTSQNVSYGFLYRLKSDDSLKKQIPISNYFKKGISSVPVSKDNSVGLNPPLFFGTVDWETVSDFKSWLTEKYNSGEPVLVDYILETPTEESIDVSEIPSLTGNVTYSIGTSTKPSKIEYGY